MAAEQAPLMGELRQLGDGNVKSFRLINAFSATVHFRPRFQRSMSPG
jgi:hypothetical protein